MNEQELRLILPSVQIRLNSSNATVTPCQECAGCPRGETCLRVEADYLTDLTSVVLVLLRPRSEDETEPDVGSADGITTIDGGQEPDRELMRLAGNSVLRVLVRLDRMSLPEVVNVLVDTVLLLKPVMPAEPG